MTLWTVGALFSGELCDTHRRSAMARRTVPCRPPPIKRTAIARSRVAAAFSWLLSRRGPVQPDP
jgi:hypothetical protein